MNKIKMLINKGAAHVIIGSFFTKFISFFGSIFLVRLLSKEDYGILSYYENILGYFMILAGLGLAAGVQRYIVLANCQGRKKDCLNYGLKRGSIWNALLVAACILFCFFYRHPQEFRGYNIVAISLSFCIPFIFFINISLSAFRALFDHKNYAYLAFFTSFILVAFRVGGAAVGGLNMSVLARVVAEIFSATLCIFLLFRKHFQGVSTIKNDTLFNKVFTRYSIQMMLTDGLWAVFMLNDLFLLGQFSGGSDIVADYKVALVIPVNLSILTASVGVFVGPYFTQHENNLSWIKKHLSQLILVTTTTVGLTAGLCFIFSSELISFIYGKQYLSASPIMGVLLLASFINNGIRSTIANVLSSMGRQQANLIVAGLGVLLQIGLDIYFIPRFGAIGVAWSSVLVYFSMATALIIYVRKTIFKNLIK